jgi:hypothetical protein
MYKSKRITFYCNLIIAFRKGMKGLSKILHKFDVNSSVRGEESLR